MDDEGLLTIGELARRAGLSVKTVRFWSDQGLVPPAERTAGNYRLYDVRALLRLQLVRTLRELGVGLADVRRLLSGHATLGDVADLHAQALEAQIRTLRLRRAVLRAVARLAPADGGDPDRNLTMKEMVLMNDLARLSAGERQQIVDDFVDSVFEGVDATGPAAGIAAGMRTLPDVLPDEPSPADVEAWVELVGLVRDPSFQARAREMVVAGQASPTPAPETAKVPEEAGAALAAGIDPASPEGRAVLDRIVDPGLPRGQREALRKNLETFTDARVERYWQLIGVLNGWPARPPVVPAFQWVIDALAAHG